MGNKRQDTKINIVEFKDRFDKATGEKRYADTARRLDLSPSELSNTLSGRRQLSVDFLLKVAQEYHCSIDELLGIETSKDDDKEQIKKIAAPTTADLLIVIDSLLAYGNASIGNHKIFGDDGYPLPIPKWSGITQEDFTTLGLVFYDPFIRKLLSEYIDAKRFKENGEVGKEMFELWFNNKISQSVPLDELNTIRNSKAIND